MAKTAFPADAFAPTIRGYFAFVNYVPDYADLVQALMGSHATANAVQLAGARSAVKSAKGLVQARAKNRTGRMESSIKAQGRVVGGRVRAVDSRGRTRWVETGIPKRRVGALIRVNRAGDYSREAGVRGGVRYGTAVHQGARGSEPMRFLYDAVDLAGPRGQAVAAMEEQWVKNRDRLIVRAKILEGMFGKEAQSELAARLIRAGKSLRVSQTKVERSALRNAGLIANIASQGLVDNEQKTIRELNLRTLGDKVVG